MNIPYLYLTNYSINFSCQQRTILNAKANHKFYAFTIDNLINTLYSLVLAMAKVNNQVLHLGEILKEPDKNDFALAIGKEINRHKKGKYYEIVY